MARDSWSSIHILCTDSGVATGTDPPILIPILVLTLVPTLTLTPTLALTISLVLTLILFLTLIVTLILSWDDQPLLA